MITKTYYHQWLITLLLITLLGLQIPVWLLKGGWLPVFKQQTTLTQMKKNNEIQRLKNMQLHADVNELSQITYEIPNKKHLNPFNINEPHSYTAIEERARYSLGMLKHNEVFVQFVK